MNYNPLKVEKYSCKEIVYKFGKFKKKAYFCYWCDIYEENTYHIMKQVIRLTESELHKIVKQVINEALNEICTIYNKIIKLIHYIMYKYLKFFKKHEDYEAYISSFDKVLPNVSFCENSHEVHYNPTFSITIESNMNITNKDKMSIFIEDFPQSVCNDDYDGDMTAFKEDFINNLQNCNRYDYTGETFTYGNQEYYLWEYNNENNDGSSTEQPDLVKYILTDTLDFDGKSLEDDIDNNYCPFIYILNSDKENEYGDNIEHGDYWLVSFRKGVRLFNDSSNISEIYIDGEKLTNMDEYYQFETNGLHDIQYVFNNKTRIEEGTFYDCADLQNFTISNTVTEIGDDAFHNCTGLITVIIGENVETIGEGAFQNCSNLTGGLVIPNSVNGIGDSAFLGCSKITSVEIGNGITAIGHGCFSECTSLANVTINANIPPTQSHSFGNNASNRKIHVSSESVNTYKEEWVEYASDIEAKGTYL